MKDVGSNRSAKDVQMIDTAIFLSRSAGTSAEDDAARLIRRRFRQAGRRVSLKVVDDSHAPQAAREAIKSGARSVVVGGGDKVVNAVARALIDTDCALGVIPLGALNHFARCSKIPLDLEGALDVLLSGRVVGIDVGEVNGRFFLNTSVIGACPQTLIRHEITRHNRLARSGLMVMAMLEGIVRCFASRVGVRVSVDDAAFIRRTQQLFIDNNDSVMKRIVAGLRPRLIEPSGLRMYMSHHRGLGGLFRSAAKMLAGKSTTEKHVDHVTSKNILIEFRQSQVNVATDGDVKPMYTPLHYRVRPEALRLIVPAEPVSRDNVYRTMD